jgi:hypothetical protein
VGREKYANWEFASDSAGKNCLGSRGSDLQTGAMKHLFSLLALAIVSLTSAASGAESAQAVVTKLYALHDAGKSPLVNPGDKQTIEKFFDSTLTRLFLRDQKEANGEIGRLDFDPLYDAQEVKIKDLKVKATDDKDADSEVEVTFKNMGEPHLIVFSLSRTTEGWRISDVSYSEGRSLKKILEADL